MKRIILTVLVLVFCAFPLRYISGAESWTKLISEETLLIIRVDLTEVDIAELARDNEKLIEAVAAICKPNNEFDLKKLARQIEIQQKYFTEDIGMDEIYLVVDLRLPLCVYLACPKNEQTKVNAFRNVFLLVQSILVKETDDFFFMTLASVMPEGQFDPAIHKQLDNITTRKITKPRPEFTEAQLAVKDYPIQILFAVPDFLKRILRETNPPIWGTKIRAATNVFVNKHTEELKPPFLAFTKKIDYWTFLDQFRWQAIGIDADEPELISVIELQDKKNVQDFLTTATDILDTEYVKIHLSKEASARDKNSNAQLQVFFNRFSELMPVEKWVSVRDKILPKLKEPEAKTLIQKISPEFIDKAKSYITDFALNYDKEVRKIQTWHNLRSIGIAFHSYIDAGKDTSFPPAFTVDADGKRLHSWRVLILPFLGDKEKELFKSIRLDEAWDSEHNKQFHSQMPNIYKSAPNDPDDDDTSDDNSDDISDDISDGTSGDTSDDKSGLTRYCVIVGKETAFKQDGKPTNIADFTDGTSNTILIAERVTPVCWMEPTDILQEDAYKGINKDGNEKGIGSNLPEGTAICFADASARFIYDDIDLKILKSLLTRDGGEVVPYEKESWYKKDKKSR